MGTTFDDQAVAYDLWYTTPLGELVNRVEQEALFGLLPSLRGRGILEVGCGTGIISRALANRGAHVVGLDRSRAMLAVAQAQGKKPKQDISWVMGEAGHLPFRDQQFDGVVSVLALDFMSERREAVAEMVRVLRPGGFLGLAMLNRYSLWTLRRILRACLKPSLWRQVQFITPVGFWRLMAHQGELINVHQAQAVYFPPWKDDRLVRIYPFFERIGRRLRLPVGAFLVGVGMRRAMASASRWGLGECP